MSTANREKRRAEGRCVTCESVPTLDSVLADVVAWQRATFWPPSLADVPSTVEHLKREIDELAASPTDTLEVADVFILLARLADNLSVDLKQAVAAKLTINRQRVWAAPDSLGITEHVRDGITP